MRKTVATSLFGIASFVLLFCLAFSAVQLVVAGESFFEKEHKKLGTGEQMGMSVGDLGKSTKQMLDYMRGKTDSLYVEVAVDGQVVEMFDQEIETVHMEEVRNIWNFFVVARSFGLLLVFALYSIAILSCKEAVLSAWSRGYLWALAFFGLIAVVIGVWTSSNFSAFWEVFHRLIFPNSENWMLPPESRMIQMLPEAFFADVVVRIVLFAVTGIGLLLLFAIGILVAARLRKNRREAISEPSGWIVDPEPEGPDLIIAHKLRNAPVRKRKQIENEVEEEALIRADVESFGEAEHVFKTESRKTEE